MLVMFEVGLVWMWCGGVVQLVVDCCFQISIWNGCYGNWVVYGIGVMQYFEQVCGGFGGVVVGVE